jgi:hypothetical protein
VAVHLAGSEPRGGRLRRGRSGWRGERILALLANAGRRPGGLMSFHDRLWLEGNVPLALLRWELLGDREDLDRLDYR